MEPYLQTSTDDTPDPKSRGASFEIERKYSLLTLRLTTLALHPLMFNVTKVRQTAVTRNC